MITEINIKKSDNPDGDFEQYQAINAILVTKAIESNLEFESIIDAIVLDTENDSEDFERFDSFINKWELFADKENISCLIDDDIRDLWFVLKAFENDGNDDNDDTCNCLVDGWNITD